MTPYRPFPIRSLLHFFLLPGRHLHHTTTMNLENTANLVPRAPHGDSNDEQNFRQDYQPPKRMTSPDLKQYHSFVKAQMDEHTKQFQDFTLHNMNLVTGFAGDADKARVQKRVAVFNKTRRILDTLKATSQSISLQKNAVSGLVGFCVKDPDTREKEFYTGLTSVLEEGVFGSTYRQETIRGTETEIEEYTESVRREYAEMQKRGQWGRSLLRDEDDEEEEEEDEEEEVGDAEDPSSHGLPEELATPFPVPSEPDMVLELDLNQEIRKSIIRQNLCACKGANKTKHGKIVHEEIQAAIRCYAESNSFERFLRQVPYPDMCTVLFFGFLVRHRIVPLATETPVFDPSIKIATAIDVIGQSAADGSEGDCIFIEVKTGSPLHWDGDVAVRMQPPFDRFTDGGYCRAWMQLMCTSLILQNSCMIAPEQLCVVHILSEKKAVNGYIPPDWVYDSKTLVTIKRQPGEHSLHTKIYYRLKQTMLRMRAAPKKKHRFKRSRHDNDDDGTESSHTKS